MRIQGKAIESILPQKYHIISDWLVTLNWGVQIYEEAQPGQ